MTKHFVKLVVIEGHYGKTNMYANMTAISEIAQSNFMDRIFGSEHFHMSKFLDTLDMAWISRMEGKAEREIYLQGKSSQEVPSLRHISVY